jgi:hypothetical protein
MNKFMNIEHWCSNDDGRKTGVLGMGVGAVKKIVEPACLE